MIQEKSEYSEYSKYLEILFKAVITNTLPSFYSEVITRKHFDDNEYIKIVIACSNYEIHKVSGQYPQCVSLMYDITLQELTIQIFGCMGGNRIFIIPQNNENLAMQSVKIPFRIARSEKSAIEALKKFCQKYLETLKDNKNILMYQQYVNYNKLLNN